MRLITLIASFFILLSACSTAPKVKTITVAQQYTLDVPEPFYEMKSLHDMASLEYGNEVDEFYVIVIDESKAEFKKALEENSLLELYPCNVDGYSNILIQNFDKNVADIAKSPVQDTIINNLPARLINVSGKVNNISVSYTYAFIEGKERFYQVMTWTLLDRRVKYNRAMKKLVSSFKEI